MKCDGKKSKRGRVVYVGLLCCPGVQADVLCRNKLDSELQFTPQKSSLLKGEPGWDHCREAGLNCHG